MTLQEVGSSEVELQNGSYSITLHLIETILFAMFDDYQARLIDLSKITVIES